MAKKKAKKAAGKKPMTKSEILTSLSESTGFSKKEIAGVFEDLSGLIGKNLNKRGPGIFTIPGLAKFKEVQGRSQACHQSSQGHQSVYQRRDDVQSETRSQRRQDSASQGT